jgi:hypothetical protein
VPDTYDAIGMAGGSDEFKAIIDEARAAIADGRQPDARVLEDRIRSAAKRQESSPTRPLKQLERVLAIHRARGALARQPAAPPAPPRRAAFRARPTITGNMVVRRETKGDTFVLAWDGAAGVVQWEVRISARPDARTDYTVRETLSLPPETTTTELRLGELPQRVHVLGRGRDGRLLRRAVVSGLTRESWEDRWQQRASAS